MEKAWLAQRSHEMISKVESRSSNRDTVTPNAEEAGAAGRQGPGNSHPQHKPTRWSQKLQEGISMAISPWALTSKGL